MEQQQEGSVNSDVLSDDRPQEQYEDSSGVSSSSEEDDEERAGQSSGAIVPVANNQVTASPGTSVRRIIPTQVISGKRIVPVQFQHCEMDDLLELVASMLVKIITYNDTLTEIRPLTRFHSKAAPAITPLAYLKRIQTFTNTDPCILLILLYYIDKLSANYLTMTSLTIHRFCISAICCGSKALSDSFATNSRYAKVGGVELLEMNALEREFLIAIDWRLATSGALLDQYWRGVVHAHDGYQLPTTIIPPSHPHPSQNSTSDISNGNSEEHSLPATTSESPSSASTSTLASPPPPPSTTNVAHDSRPSKRAKNRPIGQPV